MPIQLANTIRRVDSISSASSQRLNANQAEDDNEDVRDPHEYPVDMEPVTEFRPSIRSPKHSAIDTEARLALEAQVTALKQEVENLQGALAASAGTADDEITDLRKQNVIAEQATKLAQSNLDASRSEFFKLKQDMKNQAELQAKRREGLQQQYEDG